MIYNSKQKCEIREKRELHARIWTRTSIVGGGGSFDGYKLMIKFIIMITTKMINWEKKEW